MNRFSENTLEAASPDINAVVSASAGIGKTWLLVARLLRLLLAGETPASILAITFTQKAATEIRERLTSTLRDWTRIDDESLNAQLEDIGASTVLARQARGLYEKLIYAENDMRILTFHAFCAEILERFPFEARIPPGFEICSEEWELQDEALNRLYTIAGADKDTAQALRTLFEVCGGLANTGNALRDFLKHRNDWLAYTGEAEEPIESAIEQLSRVLNVEPEDAERRFTLDKEICKLLKVHTQLILLHETKTHQKQVETIDGFLKTDTTVDLETLRPVHHCFFTQAGDKRKLPGKLSQSLGTRYNEFISGVNRLTEALASAKDTLLRRQTFRRNRAWYIVGHCLAGIYRDLKLTRRQLDFDDLEWLACRLVNREHDAQWIQYRLNERICHVLIDEFQDTNPQQWQLLKPLLEEMASKEDGGSAFIVGDVKQSIYGFRRASPELLDEAARWLEKHMGGRVYANDLSRRSSPAVIEFVNRVFGSDSENGSNQGDGNSGSPLPRLPDFRSHGSHLNTPGSVTILPFVEKQSAKKKLPEWRHILRDPPDSRSEPHEFEEGRKIAECITRMIEERFAVHDRDGSVHPLRFGDIVLLLRNRTHLDHYERALNSQGIPHVGGRAEKLFGSLEVSDMAALLGFLINHERNLDLAQVLRSPLFAVSDEQLIALSNTEGGCWFERLGWSQDDEKLQRAHELLSGWIETARTRLPAHDLLDRVYREGDVIIRYRSATLDGEKDLVEKNLVDLLAHSLEFESGRYPDIARYVCNLKYRIAQAKNPRSPAARVGTAPDNPEHMRILTIHQVKGLEAPMVILADCGQQKPPPTAHRMLADWPPHKSRPEHFLLMPARGKEDSVTEKCREILEAREAREGMNLLYVALTRARQYLVISGSGKPGSWCELLGSRAPEAVEPETTPARPNETTTEPKPEPRVEYKPLPQVPELEIHPNTLTGTMPGPEAHRITSEGGQLRGQVIHYALKLLSEQVGEDQLRNTLTARFPQASKQLDEWIEKVRTLMGDKSLSGLFDNTRYEQVLNEVPILFTHNGQQYYGIIDRVCVGCGTVWLIDYKTHASSSVRDEAIKAHYREQMRAYYRGVTKLWPERAVRTSLLLTETGQLCDYDFERE